MLTVSQACLLGVVQGLTEFLPVSSSGHLALVHRLLPPLGAERQVAVDVALHAGTLAAVLAYFRREVAAMARAVLPGQGERTARRWAWLIVLATVPAALMLPLRATIEHLFISLTAVGVNFLLTGLLLSVASRVPDATRGESDLGVLDALVIGGFQALALLPGVSRSGSTMAAGIFRRARGDVAAKFSFLLLVPAIPGAVVVEIGDLQRLVVGEAWAALAGTLVAAASGWVAIGLLLHLVRGGRLRYFAYYCWGLGAAVLLAAALG